MDRQILYANKVYTDGKLNFEFGTDKKIPAVLTDYDDESKHLVLITGASMFSFEAENIRFTIEEFMYNKHLNVWDQTKSGVYTDQGIAVNNQFLTDTNSGLNEDEIYDIESDYTDPLNPIITKTLKQSYIDVYGPTPRLVPNFTLWRSQLGTYILGALGASAKRFLDNKLPLE